MNFKNSFTLGIIGDNGVGKTCICQSLKGLAFSSDYISTKDVDFFDGIILKLDES